MRYRQLVLVLGLCIPATACVETNAPALDYATVLDARPADVPGENTGAGAMIGAAAGGAIGSRFGSGGGNVAATVAGVVVGAALGSKAEADLQDRTGVQYTLRLDDGRVMTIAQHKERNDPVLVPGTRVVIRTEGRIQRVLPAMPANGP